MKSKTKNYNALIAILTVIVAICTIFTFVPMNFGSTQYTGVYGGLGISSELYGGLYAEYDITGEATHSDIVESMSTIKSTLEKQGYQSSNVISIDDTKIRVEIGFPTIVSDTFSKAYSVLNSVAIGALEFRSANTVTDTTVIVNAYKHIDDFSIADYNGTTYLTIELNDEGEAQLEKLVTASKTIYVYMGENLQTSFSAENMTSYKTLQLSLTDYASAEDFYHKALYGSLAVTLNSETVTINTMTALFGLGSEEGISVVLYCLVGFMVALILAGFIFFAIKYRMIAVLLMPIIMLDAVIAAWSFAAISIIEINIASLFAIIFGLAFIFGGSLNYMNRIAEEYKQGKTIDASIEAGTKKARPAQLIVSVLFVVLLAVLSLFISGQVASACLILIVFVLLNALDNIVLLPWLLKFYNHSNRKQGKPYGLKQEEGNTNV